MNRIQPAYKRRGASPAATMTDVDIVENMALLFAMTTRRGETIDYYTALARFDAMRAQPKGDKQYD